MIKRRIYGKEYEFIDETEASIQQLATIVMDRLFMTDDRASHYFEILTEFKFNPELKKDIKDGMVRNEEYRHADRYSKPTIMPPRKYGYTDKQLGLMLFVSLVFAFLFALFLGLVLD